MFKLKENGSFSSIAAEDMLRSILRMYYSTVKLWKSLRTGLMMFEMTLLLVNGIQKAKKKKKLEEESRYLDKNHYHYLLSLRTYPIYQLALGVYYFTQNPWYDFDTTLVLVFPFPFCNTQYFLHRLSLILCVCVSEPCQTTLSDFLFYKGHQ